jgi:SAM-dependent methyltransferase
MADRTADTISYYSRNAASFVAETAELEVSFLRDRYLRHMPAAGRILDAGCGSGRDALAFTKLGYESVAIDASVEMVHLARAHIGDSGSVICMRFEDAHWRSYFDGIWACASLLHVPSASFPAVAMRLVDALRPGGAWYMSFKLGEGKRIERQRLFVYHTESSLRNALEGLGVEIAEAWTSADIRPSRSSKYWLNAIALKR